MTTKEQVLKMLERAEKATPGPWEAEFPEGMDTQWLDVVAPHGCEILSAETQMRVEIVHPSYALRQKLETDQHKNNLEFVAHARTDLPELALSYLALQARVEALEVALKQTEAHLAAAQLGVDAAQLGVDAALHPKPADNDDGPKVNLQ